MKEFEPTLNLTGVDVVIDDSYLLRDVTCNFSCNGLTGLVGQNGSGKSTLMRVIARQNNPTSGEVKLGGKNLSDFSARAFAKEVAYLPQSVPSAPGMTVRELVSIGRYPWHGALGRFSKEDEEKIEGAMHITGTLNFANRVVDTLSGGERQRCWLAMLVAQNAQLLLLDEPLSALDMRHQHGALNLLKQLCEERCLAAIVILHDINLAAQFCDHIVALKSGSVVVEGPPETIMKADTLSQIFDIEMGVAPHPGNQKPHGFVMFDSSSPYATN